MNTRLDQPAAPSPAKSRSWSLTKASLIAHVIGMSAYPAFEIATSDELDLNELFTHHL